MYKTVTRVLKIFLALVATIIVLNIAVVTACSYYDAHTRKVLLREAAQELPSRASSGEMAEFMRRHTTGYSFDEKYHHEYIGIAPQTSLDRFLFDRKVQVVLKVNEDKTFLNAEVRIFYTFL